MLRSSTRARGACYTDAIVALALNVPFMVAALCRYPQDLRWTSPSGAYTLLVFAGYYVFLVYALLTLTFVLVGKWRRLFVVASTTILTLTLYYFVVDGVVYRVSKMHVDAFWLQYVVTTFDGLGIGATQVAIALFALALIVVLELCLLNVARRLDHRALWSTALPIVCAVCFAATQAIHIVAYEVSDARFTSITPELPFYFPIRSHPNALKYGHLLSLVRASAVNAPEVAGASLRYPLNDIGCAARSGGARENVLILLVESWRADAMDSVVTPQLYGFSKTASTFVAHFSSGNSTPAGVFPLFYGIHSTYWKAVKANNASIHNPVLIDALQDNGYQLGIFAKSNFKVHKLKRRHLPRHRRRGVVTGHHVGCERPRHDRPPVRVHGRPTCRGTTLLRIRLLQVNPLLLRLSSRFSSL